MEERNPSDLTYISCPPCFINKSCNLLWQKG